MNRRPKDRSRRGIFLVELIAGLVLMAGIALLATQLMMLSFRAKNQSTADEVSLFRLENALDRLRRDVWEARSAAVRDGHLELETDSGLIIWQSEPPQDTRRPASAILRRAANNYSQQWGDVPAMQFTAKGPMVTLSVIGGKTSPAPLTLISQRAIGATNSAGSRTP
jgi:hypothetical protein